MKKSSLSLLGSFLFLTFLARALYSQWKEAIQCYQL